MKPIYKRRVPSLGHYSGNRKSWKECFRAARVQARKGIEPDATHKGLRWKASLIVAFERGPSSLEIPVCTRLAALRMVRRIKAGK